MVKLRTMHTNSNGITLIALIITIIVMLILVGVTITVALNGGLFESATKAATETKKETEKEQLLSAVVGAIGTDGKVDSTKISLPEGFAKDEGKSTSSKLVVKGKEGIYWEVNLNTAAIKEYSESSTGATTYTFTIEDLATAGLLRNDTDGGVICARDQFFPANISDSLKNNTKPVTIKEGATIPTYNITCSDSSYSNSLDRKSASPSPKEYLIYALEENICFCVFNEDGNSINSENYTAYKDISFTISMW